jgi:hypothetical protein
MGSIALPYNVVRVCMCRCVCVCVCVWATLQYKHGTARHGTAHARATGRPGSPRHRLYHRHSHKGPARESMFTYS